MTRQQWSAAMFALVGLLMSGCASSLKITYISDPPGAVVYHNNQNFGYAPVTLRYQVPEEDRKRGYIDLMGTSVKWASGASASIPILRVNLNIGDNQQLTFNRPENYPGREEDVRFALELQRLAIMRWQTEVQANAAYWQRYNAINQMYQRQQPINCHSYALGSTIQTTCN